MRVPRRHRFRTDVTADELFRRLPPIHRFRLAGTGRPDTFGADPVATVSPTTAPDDPSPLLVRALRDALPRVPSTRTAGVFPGGAVGAIAYERGIPLVSLPADPRPLPGPAIWFGIYDTFAVVRGTEVEVVSWGLRDDGTFDEQMALQRAGDLESRLRSSRSAGHPPEAGREPGAAQASLARATEPDDVPFVASLDEAGHAERVHGILSAIRRGDIYQANLTVRFDVPTSRDPMALFGELLRDNPAPYATFLETDEGTVVSCSPERLLAADGRHLETRPIKGTEARSDDPARDRELAARLAVSEKDRAELLMITDLARNDLGRVCEPGTVRVPRLRAVESFPHVHHLVSTVTGQLRPGLDVLDALEASFPYGSITGAPKRRAIQILRELETKPRGVYTGTVGWIGFDRTADLAVAIRTGVLHEGVFTFGAGGGIVADSSPEAEWNELRLKAKAFALALGIPAERTADAGDSR